MPTPQERVNAAARTREARAAVIARQDAMRVGLLDEIDRAKARRTALEVDPETPAADLIAEKAGVRALEDQLPVLDAALVGMRADLAAAEAELSAARAALPT